MLNKTANCRDLAKIIVCCIREMRGVVNGASNMNFDCPIFFFLGLSPTDTVCPEMPTVLFSSLFPDWLLFGKMCRWMHAPQNCTGRKKSAFYTLRSSLSSSPICSSNWRKLLFVRCGWWQHLFPGGKGKSIPLLGPAVNAFLWRGFMVSNRVFIHGALSRKTLFLCFLSCHDTLNICDK